MTPAMKYWVAFHIRGGYFKRDDRGRVTLSHQPQTPNRITRGMADKLEESGLILWVKKTSKHGVCMDYSRLPVSETPQASGTRDVSDDVYALRVKYAKKRAQLYEAESAALKVLQGLCAHQWQWNIVAGEGKYCLVCGLADYTDD